MHWVPPQNVSAAKGIITVSGPESALLTGPTALLTVVNLGRIERQKQTPVEWLDDSRDARHS
jgi:hypothetical protein